jgi:hypothetical protein
MSIVWHEEPPEFLVSILSIKWVHIFMFFKELLLVYVISYMYGIWSSTPTVHVHLM